MPTFAPFLALGHFPFCLPKFDVSDETNLAPLTLNQAVKIHWLAYAWNFTASASITGSAPFNGSASASTMILKSGSDNIPVPRDRVCPPFFSNNFGSLDSDNFSSVSGTSLWGGIVRMYDGPTDNEANFIGYGFPGLGSGFPKTPSNPTPFVLIEAQNTRFGDASVEYQLGSYMTRSDFTDPREIRRHGTTAISVGGQNITFAYRCVAAAEDDPTTSLTAGPTGGTATSANGATTNASISGLSLEIYTPTT